MIHITPQTLVRVGRFDNPLEEAVKGFKEHLEPVPFGLGNTVKYATFKEAEESYLLMVSQQKGRLVNPAGYNVILTITSYSEQRNQQVSKQFEDETGIPLTVDVPKRLKRSLSMMGMSFKVFEKNPQAAMAALRGI